MKSELMSHAPFPYYGSKHHAAPYVWRALGDVDTYIEPFGGSAAVLLQRPHTLTPGHNETIGDVDGLLVNAWRSIKYQPDEVARYIVDPPFEWDLNAKNEAVMRWKESQAAETLRDDPTFCDPRIGGWWIWGMSVSIQMRFAKHKGHKGKPRRTNVGAIRVIGNERAAIQWMNQLSTRLSRVRILNRSWEQCIVKGEIAANLRFNRRRRGVFFDPPYSVDSRDTVYANDCSSVAQQVADWAIENGRNPELRIVLAGYVEEHGERMASAGWREIEWWDRSMGKTAKDSTRERLWASPHCLADRQAWLFGG